MYKPHESLIETWIDFTFGVGVVTELWFIGIFLCSIYEIITGG